MPTSTISTIDSLSHAWDQLLRYLQQLPAAQVDDSLVMRHIATADWGCDYMVEVKLGPHQWQIIAELLPESQMRQVRDKAQALRQNAILQQKSGRKHQSTYGVLLAPYISEKSAELCRESGVGYVDLAGNCLLAFDLVYIERRTAENPFREKREMRSVFAPKAGRILRQMLTPPVRTWKVVELQKAANVSLGYVSKVSQALLEREWAAKEPEGIRLRDASQVLKAWSDYYTPKSILRERYYSPIYGNRLEEATQVAFQELSNETKLGHSGLEHEQKNIHHAVLASFSAARYLAPFTRQSTTYFYADQVGREILRQHLKLKPTSGEDTDGANIVIDEPEEDDILQYALNPTTNILTSGLVQTYLDLFASGERGREAADHLLQEKILPLWKQSETMDTNGSKGKVSTERFS